MSPNNFTRHLMKTEWSVTDETAVESPDRVETLGNLMKIEWLAADVTAVGSPDSAECSM